MTTQITPGTYTAKAMRWAWDTTQSGAMCLALLFELADGEHGGTQIEGRLYFDTDRADAKGRTTADRSMEALRSMGLKGDLDTIDEGTGGLDAGAVTLVIENNAKCYPAVKYINAPGGSGRDLKTFAPPAQDAKRAFFAAMKARTGAQTAASRASGTGPAPKPAPKAPANTANPPRGFAPPPAQDVDDSEIPF